MDRFSIVVLLCLCTSFKIAESQTTAPNCTTVGFFEIYDGTCKNFYICVDDGERLQSVIMSCASSAIFVGDRCVPQNTTTCQQTTTMAPTTTTPFCSRYGRFSMQDVECKMYYLCYWNGGGYTIMSNLTCPNTLLFNPQLELCVSEYECPGTSG